MTHSLVTGATGFIGCHLVEYLTRCGHQVTCLVRRNSIRSRIEPFSPRFVLGDVSDLPSLRHALSNVDVVYHLAGLTKTFRPSELLSVNETGVRNIAAGCAERSNPPKLVIVSSLAAAGPSTDGHPRRESDDEAPVSKYGRSKLAGEKAAREFASDVSISIVRPPIVFGAADLDSFEMFKSVQRWGMHFVPNLFDDRVSAIHAQDLAKALELVSRNGGRLSPEARDGSGNNKTHGIYFAAATETPTYAELGRMIGRSFGRRHTLIVRNPSASVWCIALMNEMIARIRRRPHILNLDKAREATAGSWTCSPAALCHDTGFATSRTLQERLDQTAAWYCEQGWLGPGILQPLLNLLPRKLQQSETTHDT